MSDVANYFSNFVDQKSRKYTQSIDFMNKALGWTPGGKAANYVGDLVDREITQKSDLRGAQLESVVSGIPIVGDFLRGVEGASKLEDLYNNTGKVPAYPASQNLGASSLGYGAAAVARIADGSNDLYEYYSGSPDGFRSLMNGMYG